jgi:hypothetical protein
MVFTSGNTDIQAVSMLGQIFVIVEAIIGYLMLTLLVAILARRTIGD